jgi:signal transduction histidine kinase
VEEKGEAEIGRLSRSFNAMTERLRTNEATLTAQIEQLKAQQKELDASWEHVIRAEKFASVGRLAAGVAHEVGNPLTALLGYVEILKDQAADPETQTEFVERMERELKRMDTIIHGLLDYSRQEQAPVGPSNLLEIARTAAELVKPQKNLKRVDIKISLPADLPPVVVSSDKLIQVFVNLLLNAADAMDGKGEVTIQSERPSDPDGTLAIVFSDTGPGVSEDIRDKIFDPFFTTKDVGRGTGLGLAICQSIVQTMEGTIALLPGENGRGATFKITLKTAGDSNETQQDQDKGA